MVSFSQRCLILASFGCLAAADFRQFWPILGVGRSRPILANFGFFFLVFCWFWAVLGDLGSFWPISAAVPRPVFANFGRLWVLLPGLANPILIDFGRLAASASAGFWLILGQFWAFLPWWARLILAVFGCFPLVRFGLFGRMGIDPFFPFAASFARASAQLGFRFRASVCPAVVRPLPGRFGPADGDLMTKKISGAFALLRAGQRRPALLLKLPLARRGPSVGFRPSAANVETQLC